jgi:hypothetical protein
MAPPSPTATPAAHPAERALLAKKLGAVFLPERVVRRVIKEHRQIGGIGFQVPHGHCYSLPIWALKKIVAKDELGELDEGHDAVLILPSVTGEDDAAALVAVWRAAFHASVHRALEARIMAGELPPAAVRARIHALGQTEFDEIRYVLVEDDLLLPPHDDTEAYIEFAATYLEQHHFAPDMLLRTFPGLRDASALVTRTLARDIDADALLAACQPEGAPSTEDLWARVSEPPSSRAAIPVAPVAHSQRDVVDPGADIALAQGNAIRSLIYRVRAKGTEVAVQRELVDFCNRLSAAVVWVQAPTASWAEVLLPVLHHTRTVLGVPWNAEARILFDLQKACVDYEREREALGVVEWALSMGKVPVRRPLPAERDVRIAGHVLAALDKVPKTRLPEEPRQTLVTFLVALAGHAEQNVRSSLAPRLEAALDAVGLSAHDVTERAARRKLVDELLDQILKNRFIDFGQVRDSLSRNNIKLPDISADELVHGDALLRMDRLLARELDGVYRPGEIYLRSLQKLSSLGFGSRIGRFLSLYLLLPAVAAYVVLAGLEHTVGLLLVKLFGFRHVAYASTIPLVCGTVLAFALIHSATVRRAALALWRGVLVVLRAVFITVPLWLWHHDIVQNLLRTEGIRQFARFVLKPAALAGLVTLVALPFAKPALTRAIVFGAAFLVGNVLFNSTWGRALEEAFTDWSIRSFRQLHRKLLPGIFRLIVALFKRGLEVVERFIYFVDEKLIFRQGESRATFYAKAMLGIFWFFTTYLIRIYVNLLIEPEVNPIKHFPVVTVAAKIMIPFTEQIHSALMKPLAPVFGVLIAESIAAPTIFVLPGFFGFLVWELKENWRLYRMNRHTFLQPAVIGSHGETMVQFMKPGLHSGTIPKVYSKLRRASRKLDRSALKHTEALRAVEGAIRKFIERELIFLLTESPAWAAGPLSLGKVELSSNRVRVELYCERVSSEPAVIVFDEQSGYLLSQVPSLGFIAKLNIVDRIVIENGLAGLYKMAGVDLVREQVSQLLDGAAYDIGDDGLVVWPDASYRNEVVYDLAGHGATARPRVKSGNIPLPDALPLSRLVFAKQDVAWASWVAAFATREDPPRRLNQGPSLFASGQTEASFDRALTLKRL